MSKEELTMVNAFKEKYSDFCKEKDDKCILIHIRFIEAVKKESKSQKKSYRDFIVVLDAELSKSMQ